MDAHFRVVNHEAVRTDFQIGVFRRGHNHVSTVHSVPEAQAARQVLIIFVTRALHQFFMRLGVLYNHRAHFGSGGIGDKGTQVHHGLYFNRVEPTIDGRLQPADIVFHFGNGIERRKRQTVSAAIEQIRQRLRGKTLHADSLQPVVAHIGAENLVGAFQIKRRQVIALGPQVLQLCRILKRQRPQTAVRHHHAVQAGVSRQVQCRQSVAAAPQRFQLPPGRQADALHPVVGAAEHLQLPAAAHIEPRQPVVGAVQIAQRGITVHLQF